VYGTANNAGIFPAIITHTGYLVLGCDHHTNSHKNTSPFRMPIPLRDDHIIKMSLQKVNANMPPL
jgi:hypothetical protein